MLKDNDSLGDPRDMVKAHARSTGHHAVLIGGGGLHLIQPKEHNCLWCLDGTYVALPNRVEICRCVEERLILGRTPATPPTRSPLQSPPPRAGRKRTP